MISLVRVQTILTAVLIITPVLRAQHTPPASMDEAWSALIAELTVAPRDGDQSGQGMQSLLVAQNAREFYQQYPGDRRALEARRAEVQALLSAAAAGNQAAHNQLRTISSDVRKSATLPAGFRAEIAGTIDFAMAMRAARTTVDRWTAVETIARGLMLEFPDQPQGYESLLNFARYAGDQEYDQIVNEVAKAADAPASLKELAELRAARVRLRGADATELLKGLAGLRENTVTVLYTWSHQGSSDVIAELKRHDVSGTNIIGLCIDHDSPAAREFAEGQGLPGAQLFDARGPNGALATRLHISEPGVVLIFAATSEVLDSRGEHQLAQKLAKFRN